MSSSSFVAAQGERNCSLHARSICLFHLCLWVRIFLFFQSDDKIAPHDEDPPIMLCTTRAYRKPTFTPLPPLSLCVFIFYPKSPLDPEIVAKGSTIACLAQGAMATLGPKVSNSQYGLSDELNDDVQQYHVSNKHAQLTNHLSIDHLFIDEIRLICLPSTF